MSILSKLKGWFGINNGGRYKEMQLNAAFQPCNRHLLYAVIVSCQRVLAHKKRRLVRQERRAT